MKKRLHAKFLTSFLFFACLFQLQTVTAQNCDDIQVTSNANSITISGLSTLNSEIQVFDEEYNDVYYCFMDCEASTTIENLDLETYHLKIKVWDADFEKICDLDFDIDVTDGNPNPCVDADGDFICAEDDCDDNDPNLPGQPGAACDDGNDNTENDQIQSDKCTCAGTLIQESEDCDDIVITNTDNSITIAGLGMTTTSQLSLWDDEGDKYIFCVGDCNPTEMAADLEDGKYYIKIKLWNSDFELVCELDTMVCLGGDPDPGCTDADGDSFCEEDDCDDNNPNVPAAPGTPCDDMDQDTDDDVIQDDMCTCLGILQTGPSAQVVEISSPLDPSINHKSQAQVYGTSVGISKNILNVFPNPSTSNDVLFVNIQGLEKQTGSLRIFSNTGQLVVEKNFQNIDEVQYDISLEEFQTGIYFIQLFQTGQEPIIERLSLIQN